MLIWVVSCWELQEYFRLPEYTRTAVPLSKAAIAGSVFPERVSCRTREKVKFLRTYRLLHQDQILVVQRLVSVGKVVVIGISAVLKTRVGVMNRA